MMEKMLKIQSQKQPSSAKTEGDTAKAPWLPWLLSSFNLGSTAEASLELSRKCSVGSFHGFQGQVLVMC
jgi:hypothetical protein